MRNRWKNSDSEFFGGKVRYIGVFYGEPALVDVENARGEFFQRFSEDLRT